MNTLVEERLLVKLKEAIVSCDEERAKEAANDILKIGLDPIEVIEKNLTPAMKTVGERFERGEYFLTHLMMAAEAMKTATINCVGQDHNR